MLQSFKTPQNALTSFGLDDLDKLQVLDRGHRSILRFYQDTSSSTYPYYIVKRFFMKDEDSTAYASAFGVDCIRSNVL